MASARDRSPPDAQMTPPAAASQRYRPLYDLGAQPILTVDGDGRLVDANPSALKFLWVAPGGLAGRHVSSLVATSDRDRVVEQLEGALHAGSGRFSTTFTDGIGAARPVEVTVVPIAADTGQPGSFLILDDVTDRHNARRELDAGERRFRTLIDNVSDHALLLTDWAGVISTWNRTAWQLTGQPPDDAIGRPVRDLFDEPDVFDALLHDLGNGLPPYVHPPHKPTTRTRSDPELSQ